MNGEKTLYTALVSDSAITSIVDTVNGYPAIAVGIREPLAWTPELKTISVYNSTGMDARDKRMIVELTLNIRCPSESECKTIAEAIADKLRGTSFLSGRGAYYPQYGGVIPPQDETDSYNLPMTIGMKAGEVVD